MFHNFCLGVKTIFHNTRKICRECVECMGDFIPTHDKILKQCYVGGLVARGSPSSPSNNC